MAYTPLQPPVSQRPALVSPMAIKHNIIRDQFTITTWILFGAVLHGILTYILPIHYALLPAVLILFLRFIDTLLQYYGLIENRAAEGVVRGKFSAQIPDREGNAPSQPAEHEIVVLHLATRSNHPLGLWAPGYQQVTKHMQGLLADLDQNSHENGFLGSTSWLPASERKTSNQLMVAVYFRSYKDVHNWAHSQMHLKVWKWFNNVSRQHPHLSIMHETYVAPRGHSENIYVNFHRTGLAATNSKIRVGRSAEKDDFQWISPLVDASRGALRSSRGRLGTADGADNDQYRLVDY